MQILKFITLIVLVLCHGLGHPQLPSNVLQGSSKINSCSFKKLKIHKALFAYALTELRLLDVLTCIKVDSLCACFALM